MLAQTTSRTQFAALAEAKRKCRAKAHARRRAAAAVQPQAGEALCAALAQSRLLHRRAALVGGYAAFGSEIDALPLLRVFLRAKRRIALPVMAGKELQFTAWDGRAPLRRGRLGVPAPRSLVAVGVPNILLVPVLAYDAAGHRLGRGGGHYDRFLAWARAQKSLLAVGLAFAEQEMPSVPCGARDQKLDAVCTPRGFVWTRAGAG